MKREEKSIANKIIQIENDLYHLDVRFTIIEGKTY